MLGLLLSGKDSQGRLQPRQRSRQQDGQLGVRAEISEKTGVLALPGGRGMPVYGERGGLNIVIPRDRLSGVGEQVAHENLRHDTKGDHPQERTLARFSYVWPLKNVSS